MRAKLASLQFSDLLQMQCTIVHRVQMSLVGYEELVIYNWMGRKLVTNKGLLLCKATQKGL